ncbi:MAG TPA: T9SS type A sorting domain-containing protein, partial [Rhodothermales bacterium]|nr:T9SS type A sorting domain-containing protein [Rhodothermales bacterium]
PITDFRVGLFIDSDLGCPSDDYVASDVARGMIYSYNADNDDALCDGVQGYGLNPPALGMDLLQGTPEALMYFVNEAGIPTNDPSDGQGYYNILRGLWKDGTPMTEGAFGYLSAGAVTRYAFSSGNPITPTFWSERCNNSGACAVNTPGDRRMIASVASGTLQPGAPARFDLALIYARGTSNLNSITVLQSASDAVQTAYNAGTLFPATGVPPVAAEGGPAAAVFALTATPNPATGAATVAYTLPEAARVRVTVYDVLGRAVAVLAEGAQSAGAHTAALDAAALPAGPYLVVLDADGARATTRVTVE